MTDNDQHNQANRHRRDPSAPVEQQEHETHITALVLLSLATIIAIAIIFAVSQNTADLDPGNYDDETGTTTQQVTEPDDETNGYAVPVETVQSTDVSGLSELPSDLPIPEDAEVTRNTTADIGQSGTQRIYMYNTSESISDMVSAYESWMSQSDFSVTDTETNDSNATLRSETENEQLVVSITQRDGGREVQVNYVNN